MEEKRLTVLTQKRCGTMFHQKTYNLFITDANVYFVRITKQDYKEAQQAMDASLKGKSFNERLSLLATNRYALPPRYHTMSLKDMLEEHVDNFKVTYSDIQKIKIKRPKTRDSKGLAKDDYFVIQTTQKKHKVTPASKEELKRLQEILGDRVKVPFIIL